MAELKTAALLAGIFVISFGLIKLFEYIRTVTSGKRTFEIVSKVSSEVIFWLYAAALAALNFANIFDRVVWGDEGWSARMGQLSYSGIWFMVKTYDTHPPFYYLWLHTFEIFFGNKGWVMHLASFVPYLAVLVFACVVLRKIWGKIPAMLFAAIISLSCHSVEYNVEIRMYSLASAALIFALFGCYKVLEGKRAMWILAVAFSLVGAYSHYYAMMSCGLLLFITAVLVLIKKGVKDGLIGGAAVAAYIIGYIPWILPLFYQTGSVSNNWWNDDLMSVKEAAKYICGGPGFWLIVLGAIVISVAAVIVIMTGVIKPVNGGKRIKIKEASPEIYATALAGLTIVSTLAAAYVLCKLVAPILVDRYLYPLIAVAAFVLATSASTVIKYLKEADSAKLIGILKTAYIAFLLSVFVILSYRGFLNWQSFKNISKVESEQTEKTLATIGEAGDDVYFVSNGVKHIGWTVLPYYYDGKDVTSADCFGVTYDRFWYFSPDEVSEDGLKEMENRGYKVEEYGVNQLAKYLFHMYYFEK